MQPFFWRKVCPTLCDWLLLGKSPAHTSADCSYAPSVTRQADSFQVFVVIKTCIAELTLTFLKIMQCIMFGICKNGRGRSDEPPVHTYIVNFRYATAPFVALCNTPLTCSWVECEISTELVFSNFLQINSCVSIQVTCVHRE